MTTASQKNNIVTLVFVALFSVLLVGTLYSSVFAQSTTTSSTTTTYQPYTPTQNQQTVTVPPGANPLCSTVAIKNSNGVGYTFPQCCNGIDDDKDGTADYYGTTTLPPDPKCLYAGDTETETTPSTSQIIPCTDKCTLADFFQMINNFINFLFKYLLLPFIVFLIMYAGYTYFASQFNATKRVHLGKLLGHIVLGLVLILASWLIVKTVLLVLINPSSSIGQGVVQFFQ